MEIIETALITTKSYPLKPLRLFTGEEVLTVVVESLEVESETKGK